MATKKAPVKKVEPTKKPAAAKIEKKEYKNLNEALFAFQELCPSIPRNGTGKTPDGREYKYATLDDVLAITKPVLQKCGLMITQPMSGNELVTTLIHVGSGEEKTSSLPLGAPERSQDLGSRITYLRRYQIASLLGLSLEPDTDAKPGNASAPIAAAQTKAADDLRNNSKDVQATGPAGAMNAAEAKPAEVPTIEVSESFKKAQNAISACATPAALTMIRGQIEKSAKFNDEERATLLKIVDERATALPPF